MATVMNNFLQIETNFFLEPTLPDTPIDKTVSVVIPWRETPSRVELFNYLIGWYSNNFPSFKIVLSDSEHETFNLAASRNIGIKRAFDDGSDIVICSDSDVFVSKDSIVKSILNAIDTNNITIPYKELRKITKDGTDRFLQNDAQSFDMLERKASVPYLVENEPQRLSPCAGILIITKNLFSEFGGFDESYSGWGVEDVDYHKRYLDKYGRLFDYIDGSIISLYHSKEEWLNPDNRNVDLFKSKHGSDYIF